MKTLGTCCILILYYMLEGDGDMNWIVSVVQDTVWWLAFADRAMQFEVP